MPNGERINHPTAVQTVAEVIEKLGIDRVRRVDPDVISSSQSPVHRYRLGQYYIRDRTSTRYKRQILETIADRLGVQLEVTIVPKS